MATNSEQQLEINRCPIWPEFPAEGSIYPEDGIAEIDSDRAGGGYTISVEATDLLKGKTTFSPRGEQGRENRSPRISQNNRVKLTTWLIEQFLSGNQYPHVTPEVISSVKSQKPLPARERADRLLRFIASETPVLGSVIEFDRHAGPSNARGTRHKATLRAFAWAESSRWLELNYLLDYLTGNGWLEHIYKFELPTNYYRVTVDGHTEIARKGTATDSSKVFVAMWFDDSMNEAYYQGIEPAIRAAGYNPSRIDNVEYTGQIEDAIIAEIRKSKFVVADLTEGDRGARGGVYFEAGFALGLGLTVIYTCQKDKFDLVHFDANHQAHILWTDSKNLRTRLKSRIEAVVGPGPLEHDDDQDNASDSQSSDELSQ